MKKINSVFLIDPQSYNNLAIYDENLISNLNINKKVLLGNIKFENNKNIHFIDLYKYSNKKFFLKILSYFFSQIKLLKNIIKNKPDVIHFQWFKLPYLDFWLLKFIKRFNLCNKVIYTAHNILPHDTGKKYKMIFNKIYDIVDGIIVHTDSSKKRLADEFSIKRDKVRVIPHGVLELNYDPKKTKKLTVNLIKKFNLKNKIVFSFLGYIRKNKGIELILNCWENESFLNENKEVVLLIAGNCSDNDIKKRLEELNRFDNVIIDIRFLPINDFAAYLKLSDVVLLPYKIISQSGILLSSIFEEKPVLVTNIGGLTDPYKIGKVGWIIDPDENSLKRKLKHIINNSDEIMEIKNNKKLWKKVKAYFSWENIGIETKNFYEYIYNK